MKRLILLLLFIVLPAHADQWLETTNQAGGKILLLNSRCSDRYPTLYLMMATLPTGRTIYGCWGYFSDMVHVVYDDGQTYSYPPSIFELKKR